MASVKTDEFTLNTNPTTGCQILGITDMDSDPYEVRVPLSDVIVLFNEHLDGTSVVNAVDAALGHNNWQGSGVDFTAANTWTNTQTIDVPDNTKALGITGYAVTGTPGVPANAVTLSGTFNTTTSPTAIDIDITDTASGQYSLLFNGAIGVDNKIKFGKPGLQVKSTNLYSDIGPWHDTSWYNTGIKFSTYETKLYSNTSLMAGWAYLYGFYIGDTDTQLWRTAANTLALKQDNTANPCEFHIYNDDTTGNEIYGNLGWNGSNFEIKTVDVTGGVVHIDLSTSGAGIVRAAAGIGFTNDSIKYYKGIFPTQNNNNHLLFTNGAGGHGIVVYCSAGAFNINTAGGGYFGFSSGHGAMYTTPDLALTRASANKLQLGLNHATTATDQTIKAHDVTTGVGADIIIAGGDGSTGKGAVILNGGNRVDYIETPGLTEIRDALISHGIMKGVSVNIYAYWTGSVGNYVTMEGIELGAGITSAGTALLVYTGNLNETEIINWTPGEDTELSSITIDSVASVGDGILSGNTAGSPDMGTMYIKITQPGNIYLNLNCEDSS